MTRIMNLHGKDFSKRLILKLSGKQHVASFSEFVYLVEQLVRNHNSLHMHEELMNLAIQFDIKITVGILVIKPKAIETPRNLSFFQVQYKLKYGRYPITEDELLTFIKEIRHYNVEEFKCFYNEKRDVKMLDSDNQFFKAALFVEPEAPDPNLDCFANDQYAYLKHSSILIGGDIYDAFSLGQIQAIFSQPDKFYTYWKGQYFFLFACSIFLSWIIY